jgi:hypothetical protein
VFNEIFPAISTFRGPQKLLQFYCVGGVFHMELVRANTPRTCRSFKTKGNLWCREGESNPQDPKVGGF